jgi:hypothetical protein
MGQMTDTRERERERDDLSLYIYLNRFWKFLTFTTSHQPTCTLKMSDYQKIKGRTWAVAFFFPPPTMKM